ncbi:Protein CHROMOSOME TRANSMISSION FIDELITY 7 [Zea mays]|uniref:Protein CHROMOSOME TRANSMISSION FIDELITY 7 n=1 Tax=Zea mays TaxID=4577 RepID=A0A3L6G1L9_MAIZE|nr:Protein CHROMOSOME TRANSMISSION FIDELITY 7 [Zea mays]
MQPKISAFFKRQETDPDPISGDDEGNGQGNVGATTEAKRKTNGCRLDGLVSKKRNYAQLHLELGQPDFVLHTCSVCGMMYARGNDEDEKVHRAYHKSYSEGVPFKVKLTDELQGWKKETVIARSEGGDRVVLATDENSCMSKSKVKEVITVVEKELGFGEGKLLHKLCKVYLYISAQRIVGCLVTEPIKTGHRVIPSSTEGSPNDLPVTERGKNGHTLEFGSISFKREIITRHSRSVKNKEECQDPGAILCETEAVPALCGFRAIWVAPSCRRKRIASKLMDVARKTFFEGRTLGISQFAFSPPTSSGKGLACRYCKTSAFLVYKDGPV